MKLPKVVIVEVLTQDNKRVLSRHRFSAGEQQKGMRFTAAGVDQIINTFCTKFEMDNPGHQYRLAELTGAKFRLVWGDHKPISVPTKKQRDQFAADCNKDGMCRLDMESAIRNNIIPPMFSQI